MPAIRRACMTGSVEVLGGFEAIPPSPAPGWIVTITTRRGAVSHVAIIPDDIGHRYRVVLVRDVPWHLWVGQPLARTAYSVYQGDHPAAYEARRDLAIESLGRKKYVGTHEPAVCQPR